MGLLFRGRGFHQRGPIRGKPLARDGIAEGHAGPLAPQPAQHAGLIVHAGLFGPGRDLHRADLPAVGQQERDRRQHGRMALHRQRAVLPTKSAIGIPGIHHRAGPPALAFSAARAALFAAKACTRC